jgi:hypothetical protein
MASTIYNISVDRARPYQLADPEGNEFCLLRSAAERARQS